MDDTGSTVLMIDLDAIEARIRDCKTYNFGLWNADKLAHDDAPAMLNELRHLRVIASGNQGAIVNSIIERTRHEATHDEREALLSSAHKEADQRYGETDWTDGPGSSTFRRVDRGKAGAFVDGALWRDRRGQLEPSDAQELLEEADALIDSWDQKGSWSADSPVGMVMRLAAALRAAGGAR